MTVRTPQHLADRPLSLSPYQADVRVSRVTHELVNVSKRRKLAIMGAQWPRYSYLTAVLDDPAWEIWTCNLVAPLDSCGRLRADRWFDLHQRVAQSDDDLRWIAACPVPIYLPPDLLDASPNAVAFPLARLEYLSGRSYWACTFAYQVALAISEGEEFEEILLYGVDLKLGTTRERTIEWANLSWWAGVADGMGIKVSCVPDLAVGGHVARYGLEYEAERDRVQEYVTITEQIAHINHLRRAGIIEQ